MTSHLPPPPQKKMNFIKRLWNKYVITSLKGIEIY